MSNQQEKKKKRKGNVFITVGLLLIGAALLLVLYNIAENMRAQRLSEEALTPLREQITAAADSSLDDKTSNAEPLYKSYNEMTMPEISINGVNYIGILSVPSLGLELPVRGDFSYPALVSAPCRYDGSVYLNNMIVAGHNYSSHFGNLKRLKIGDEVNFTDGDGNIFEYKVSDVVQIGGTEVEEMKSGDWDMTLFTCTVSGKSRVTVRLELVDK
jgi:sortase A